MEAIASADRYFHQGLVGSLWALPQRGSRYGAELYHFARLSHRGREEEPVQGRAFR